MFQLTMSLEHATNGSLAGEACKPCPGLKVETDQRENYRSRSGLDIATIGKFRRERRLVRFRRETRAPHTSQVQYEG